MEDVHSREVKIEHPRCPFCHENVSTRDEKRACDECMAWHHSECWQNHGRCSACGFQRFLGSEQGAVGDRKDPLQKILAELNSGRSGGERWALERIESLGPKALTLRPDLLRRLENIDEPGLRARYDQVLARLDGRLALAFPEESIQDEVDQSPVDWPGVILAVFICVAIALVLILLIAAGINVGF